MHDSEAELNVGQKSAQMGYTETVLNITFYNIDVRNIDCLYVLPAKTPDASDFSAARFDPALELSPHLSKIFSEVKNVGHKRAGTTNLYIRGSRSRAGLKSVPVGFIVLDELDEMTQENVRWLLKERRSGQLVGLDDFDGHDRQLRDQLPLTIAAARITFSSSVLAALGLRS
jgi:phage terminase large subunit GpA-like protein